MTLYRATVMDTPRNPFVEADALNADSDVAIMVRDGVITARGPYAELITDADQEEVVDLRGGVLLPGMVDTHVHYPQIRALAGLGMPLLDWLEKCALPEEARLAEDAYAHVITGEFLTALASAGTTTALVFGAHFASAMDVLFEAADRSGLRITAGQVVSDRILRPDLLTRPAIALSEGRELIERWHGRGRLRYAVTPRFSLSTTDAMLDSCAELMQAADGLWFTSHLNENLAEVAEVRQLFPGAGSYLDSYDQHGLVTERSVFAHNVHADRCRTRPAGVDRRLGLALPDEQLRPGQRAVPAAAARRAWGPGGDGLRCRRRHRLLDAQGGPAGLFHAATARRRRPPADPGASALPLHAVRGPGTRAG